MALRFYNTLTRQIEEFVPREEGRVCMYSCGPTVYDRVHIGNLRAFLFCDLVRRYLKYRGYQVYAVMNITDVDDKTIRGARQEGVSLREYTEKYTRLFFEDQDLLKINPVDLYPRATEHIPEMVEMVQKLVATGHAYEMDGSYYYKVDTFPHYGELARLDVSGQRRGERVASDEYEKEDVRDFALWKHYEKEDGEVFWETPLGKGRPGWHLECSAMSLKYLGEDFDIHTGGVDLIFPHHQNEIAQTEAATGKRLARFWLHNEHLLVDGAKMSKSLGNFYTHGDLMAQGWKPREIRYALLAAHYRQQLNFTSAGLEQARGALERLDCCARNLRFAAGGGGMGEVRAAMEKYERDFREALDDDLNYPNALAAVFNVVREVNTLCAQDRIGRAEAEEVQKALRRFDTVLGFIEGDGEGAEFDEEIEALVWARDVARREKNWAEADRIRNLLLERNVIVEDRGAGSVWRRK